MTITFQNSSVEKCQDTPTLHIKLELEGLRDQGNMDGWNLYGVPHAMQWTMSLGLSKFVSSTIPREHDTSKSHNPYFITILLWTKACMIKMVIKKHLVGTLIA